MQLTRRHLTRRQRRFWVGIGFTVAGLLLVATFWLDHSTTWTSSGRNTSAGVSVHRFGTPPYLEVERTGVDASGQRVSRASTSSTTINWLNLCLNIYLTIFIPVTCWFGVTYVVRKTRLPAGICDECGYDLRQSQECCPECGAKIASVAPLSSP